MFHIEHCGELVRENMPASSLLLYFSAEAKRMDNHALVLSMITGDEETYELEDLTTKLFSAKKSRKMAMTYQRMTPFADSTGTTPTPHKLQ